MASNSITVKSQKKSYRTSFVKNGKYYLIVATVRYDDECGNGRNSFAITGTVYRGLVESELAFESGGCIHEEVAKRFPGLAPLIKWHGWSAGGGHHYLANSIYFAGDIDHNGNSPTIKRQIRNGSTGQPVWRLVKASDNFPEGFDDRFGSGLYDADRKPAPVTVQYEWEPATHRTNGKERELDRARSSAVWLDATDEDLTAPGLEQRLQERLPALEAEFKAAVKSLGFVY